MEINFCIHTFNAAAADILDTVRAVEDHGFGGVSFADELMDVSGGGGHAHDVWTLIAASAAVTERISVGSMVLNIANRDAGTTAVAAATLQDIAGGRVWLGLGMGGGADDPFAADQIALGRIPGAPRERRAAMRRYLAELGRVWDTKGFLSPAPGVPLYVGTFGPLGARLAGAHADGVALAIDGFGEGGRSVERLFDEARLARAEAGRPDDLRLIVHTGPEEDAREARWARGSQVYDRVLALGADRLVLFIDPSPSAVADVARRLPWSI